MPLLSPYLADKLTDWELLARAGGQPLMIDKDVLELGPSYGIDLMMWAPYARSYTMLDSAQDVHAHLAPLLATQRRWGRSVNLIDHNMQQPFPLPANAFDVVIDFGTIDNVLADTRPFHEALRVLKPGGVLLSTYANRDVFVESTSPSGDEIRFRPGALTAELLTAGSALVAVFGEDQPRAGVAVRKL